MCMMINRYGELILFIAIVASGAGVCPTEASYGDFIQHVRHGLPRCRASGTLLLCMYVYDHELYIQTYLNR